MKWDGEMKETELYAPLKAYLEGQGFEVKGEVMDCDVVAVRADEEPIVVELKVHLNLQLLLQATDRLKLTSTVYMGVPSGTKVLRKQMKRVVKLVRMLGLGLLEINVKSGNVIVIQDPGPYQPKVVKKRQCRLLGEFAARVGDPNLGGKDRRHGLMTAYRQRALGIAMYLLEQGPTKAANIATALADPKARDILYRNVYGWFDRLGTGIYSLSPKGQQELPQWVNLDK